LIYAAKLPAQKSQWRQKKQAPALACQTTLLAASTTNCAGRLLFVGGCQLFVDSERGSKMFGVN